MSIIHRQLLFNFLRNFGYAMIASLVLIILVDLLDHIGNFVDNDASIGTIVRFYFFKMGWIIDLTLPIAMLMATMFTIGSMARYLELTALFSSGWSLMKICRPLILLSIFMMFFSLAWREFILPESNTRAHRVWEVEIHKQPDRITPTERITLTDGLGRMYYAREFNPNSGILTDLKIITSEDASVTERIDATRAEWSDGTWTLFDGNRRTFKDGEEVITYFDQLAARDLTIDPKSFYQDRVIPENMNIQQLLRHTHQLRLTGGDPTICLVDIQFNLAFPFVNVIVVLMGMVLASAPRKTTVASGFGLTLLVTFGYYLFINLGRSLGHNGTLHPLVAGWGGNALYFLVFLVLFLRARR